MNLKPCPFCGGKCAIARQGTRRVSKQYECTECGASLETGETDNSNSRWNTRAAMTPPADGFNAGVEELTRAADYLIGRLENCWKGIPVRDLDEAQEAYRHAKQSALKRTASAMPSAGVVDLRLAYIGLLQLPLGSLWRTQNQPLYAALRDAVAEIVGMSSENTQNSCEEVAYQEANRFAPTVPTVDAEKLVLGNVPQSVKDNWAFYGPDIIKRTEHVLGGRKEAEKCDAFHNYWHARLAVSFLAVPADTEAVRNAALEEAAKACEAEKVSYETTKDQGDGIYNRACDDCRDNVLALKLPTPAKAANDNIPPVHKTIRAEVSDGFPHLHYQAHQHGLWLHPAVRCRHSFCVLVLGSRMGCPLPLGRRNMVGLLSRADIPGAYPARVPPRLRH